MTSLLDIAPASEFVDVGGTKIEVFGVSAQAVALLFGRFPELRKLMSGVAVDAEQISAFAPGAIAGIIAAGVGQAGDETTEAHASRFGIDVQADLLAAIFRLTFPRGIAPFVEKLAGLGASAGVQSPTAPGPSSPKPSRS
ncbi:MAG: hypothetical protein JWM84_4033 [Nocardioides sp.]|nr:hypothetical protein [Nocardioides sp.]